MSSQNLELLALQCRQMLMSRVPQELIERLEVRPEDDDFKVEVRLKREPTGEELEQLNGVIMAAVEEFRVKLRENPG